MMGVRRLGVVAVVAAALGVAQLTGVLRSSPLPEAAADTAATIVIRPGGFGSSFSPASVSLEHGARHQARQQGHDGALGDLGGRRQGRRPAVRRGRRGRGDRQARRPPDPRRREVPLLLPVPPQHARHPRRHRQGRRCPRTAGVRAGPADSRGADREQDQHHDEAGEGPDHADGSADHDVDLRRDLPRTDDQAADRVDHQGHVRQRPAEGQWLDDRAPARGPPVLRRRRPAHPVPHRTRVAAHLHVSAHRRRRADAGRVPLLPRPPDGPDGPEQLVRAAGHVPGHRPGRARAGPPTRRVRRPAAPHRPQPRRPRTS